MLILSRKLLETIVITTASGERIEVAVMDFSPGRVRIGITADQSVIIDRAEVHRRKADADAGTYTPCEACDDTGRDDSGDCKLCQSNSRQCQGCSYTSCDGCRGRFAKGKK
jgi:carbon storage regulator CsrA